MQQRYARSLAAPLFTVYALFTAATVFAASNDDTERMIRKITPPISVIEAISQKKDSWYFDCYYEPSIVMQGNRTGRWLEITNTFGYTHNNIQGYFSISELGRLGVDDYTANFGLYVDFKDYYFHLEPGFGWDVDYTYDFQNIAEYGHRLYKSLFWQIGYNYRMYRISGDTHNLYPGLIYYFGNSYISGNFGASFVEGRDTSTFGVVKGDFEITEFLHWNGGAAFGERLYDIYARNAAQETGYIVFTGLNLKFYKGISARVGCSYGMERPKFIKRSLNFGLSAKF